MNRQIAIDWAEMLLSNPDVQGIGSLAPTEHTRCCLGVLTEMVSDEDMACSGYLSDAVVDSCGMKSAVGLVKCEGEENSLSRMNDKGTSWEEIALIIEANSDLL